VKVWSWSGSRNKTRPPAAKTASPARRPGPFAGHVSLKLEYLEDRVLPAGFVNPATVPQPGNNQSYFQARELENLAAKAADPQVVFLGDSILDRFAQGPGAATWNASLAPIPAADFAVDGNATQQVLWQVLDDHDLDGLSARVVVLMIGINNLVQGESPEEAAGGVAASVAVIEAKQPQARVLLLGVLPAGQAPTDPRRALVEETNALIAPLGDGPQVHFLDLGQDFLGAGGWQSASLFIDGVHPTAQGYQVLAQALARPLAQLLAAGNLPSPDLGAGGAPVRPGGVGPSGAAGIGLYDPGSATWYILSQEKIAGLNVTYSFQYGLPYWQPVVGQWDGTAVGIGVYNPATATWYLRDSLSPGVPQATFQYGAPGWIPVVGDWNGDGKTTIGVVDPATMTWYLRNSNSAGPPDLVFQYGASGWTPVVGDWNGDGRTTVGVIDPVRMMWYLRNENSGGTPDAGVFQYGVPGWAPVVGDWNGYGTSSFGVVDPAGVWHLFDRDRNGWHDLPLFTYGTGMWIPLSGL
jgi:lysophospholipase L1-like esterase